MLDPTDIVTLPLPEILASGGDSRQQVDPATGRNKYGCSYQPDPDLIAFGSCTASTISETGWAAAERVHSWLRSVGKPHLDHAIDDLHETVRQRVLSLLVDRSVQDVDIMLTPSGTDAELVVLALFGGDDSVPIENIVVGPAEVGSGTSLAAAGVQFDALLPSGVAGEVGRPVDDELATRTTVRHVLMRSDLGEERSATDLDEEVRSLTEDALLRNARVLIHVVAHSKTGVHAPTLQMVDELASCHPDRVGVVIDAAQGRFSRRGLNESLRRGRVVILTGSKFFGGPPFAGALLIPPGWSPAARGVTHLPTGFGNYFSSAQPPQHWSSIRSALPPSANVGLLLRWHAALEEMSNYYAVPSRLRLEVLRQFESMVPAACARSSNIEIHAVPPLHTEDQANRLLESKTTVFPFFVFTKGRRMTHEELSVLYRLMRIDLTTLTGDDHPEALRRRVLIGQPVRLTRGSDGPAVLRVAISGTQITETSVGTVRGASFEARVDALRSQLDLTIAKIDALAQQFDRLRQLDGETP